MNSQFPARDDNDVEYQIVQAVNAGNSSIVQEWASRISFLPDAQERVTRMFLNTAYDAPEELLRLLVETGLVKLDQPDEINERNILHKGTISGRTVLVQFGLMGSVDVKAVDIYGRIPLHYACMYGHVNMVQELLKAAPETIDFRDQDNFTPLIHAIVHSQLACVQTLFAYQARVDPVGENDHIPLNLACQHGAAAIVEVLLQRLPQILPDAEGLYPQHLVARAARTPQLLLMLREYGADLDQPDKLYQWTPIFHAASEGNIACLHTLLECGVNPIIKDEKGLSAMYYATWEGHLECMKLLASVGRANLSRGSQRLLSPATASIPQSSTPAPMSIDAEGIPPMSLPPPMIPVRRYGHNFLDTKTFVLINFGDLGFDAIEFYDNTKYPAARLTISSRSSDLIPRNVHLPIQDDSKIVSFQINNLDTFAVDFDIYPTFGSRVIARAVASSRVFTGKASSSGLWHLELFDPRLRAIGRISFEFHVITPFPGIPLEITNFATYWKATSQLDSQPHALITGSSLSGEYARLFVQMTADGVPVLYPQWKVNHHGLEVCVNSLTYDQFASIGMQQGGGDAALTLLSSTPANDLSRIHHILAASYATLRDALAVLPGNIHVELHALYPNPTEEDRLRLGPTPNINAYVDALLTVVFEHARHLREQADGFLRSIVLSSFNPDVCTALNWKQPNCKHRSFDVAFEHKTNMIYQILSFSATSLAPTSHSPQRIR